MRIRIFSMFWDKAHFNKRGKNHFPDITQFINNKIGILLTKSLDVSRFSSILGVKNDLKGIAPSRSFENIKFYRWLKISVAQKHLPYSHSMLKTIYILYIVFKTQNMGGNFSLYSIYSISFLKFL